MSKCKQNCFLQYRANLGKKQESKRFDSILQAMFTIWSNTFLGNIKPSTAHRALVWVHQVNEPITTDFLGISFLEYQCRMFVFQIERRFTSKLNKCFFLSPCFPLHIYDYFFCAHCGFRCQANFHNFANYVPESLKQFQTI